MWLRNSADKTLAIRAFDDVVQKRLVLSTTLEQDVRAFGDSKNHVFVLSMTGEAPSFVMPSAGIRLCEIKNGLIRLSAAWRRRHYLNKLKSYLAGFSAIC